MSNENRIYGIYALWSRNHWINPIFTTTNTPNTPISRHSHYPPNIFIQQPHCLPQMAKTEKTPTAEDLAQNQKEISIAEFFEKNRQILGFDSLPRCLITTVKEAVDNSLDACEESNILPDVFVKIERVDETEVRITVEDNGPGIVREQIPRVFGKLLYGSRFHALKQSRGQQGIGISAAVLYGQLTSGKPTRITSKTGMDKPAHHFELVINTKTNEPEIVLDEVVEWDRPRGTRVEITMAATYVKGRRQSIPEYMKATSVVNPHARLTLIDPEGLESVYERATDKLPIPSTEIKPHPHGIELGTLIKMLRYTEKGTVSAFLRDSFSRIGTITAEEICKKARVDLAAHPSELDVNDAKKLISAFMTVKISAPPTDCLSPITESLIYEGIKKEFNVDFIATTTRPAAVHNGNPFIVEAAICYGGSLSKDDRVDILRFANRVPLLYQQGGCAITHSIENITWKNYSLNQPGKSIPAGPAVILVHVASTNVPFTSESKDAIADTPEIANEIKLAVQEVARNMKAFISRQSLLSQRKEKEKIITQILPKMAKKVAEILGREIPNINPVVAKIMGNLLIHRTIEKDNGVSKVSISINNNTDAAVEFKLHCMMPYKISGTNPEPRTIALGDEYDYIYPISMKAGRMDRLTFVIDAGEEEIKLDDMIAEGLEAALVTGAKGVIS